MTPSRGPEVLILGAGINGAALARELTVAGIGVRIVDTGDVASGSTAYSSRLIHGGLRYLEYGEFDLVRESLAERGRLLRNAPHLVRPLRLWIPVRGRLGGMRASVERLLGWSGGSSQRGLWLVRAGLSLYELFGRDPLLPRHTAARIGQPLVPPVDPAQFDWALAFHDAQIRSPERLVVAMLEDARHAAAERGVTFALRTRSEARLEGDQAVVRPAGIAHSSERESVGAVRFRPAAVVNATGAWVDLTLATLAVKSELLIGGTKGCHLVTWQPTLCAALGPDGLYVEAADGRPVFVLPLGDAVLIGTTDLPFSGRPEDVAPDADEIAYLVAAVNRALPTCRLAAADIAMRYSGVRPLPAVAPQPTPGLNTSAITRRHRVHEHAGGGVPIYSIVGGKLTTCRSLAEETADLLLARFARTRRGSTRERPLPGGEDWPATVGERETLQRRIARDVGLSLAQVRAVWELCGTRSEGALAALSPSERTSVVDTDLPRGFVRHVIRREHVGRVEDLVERRLMLVYDRRLTRATLRELAGLLADEGRLSVVDVAREADAAADRLLRRFGRRIIDSFGT